MLNPLLLGLAAMATLLALAVAGILAALYRKHSTGRPGSPKHAPIVCEPPNAGATTPVHPQTKQAVDDIDPDIIPNEYGKSGYWPITQLLEKNLLVRAYLVTIFFLCRRQYICEPSHYFQCHREFCKKDRQATR